MKNPYVRFFLLIATLFVLSYALYECSCLKTKLANKKAEQSKQDIGLGYTPAFQAPVEVK